MSITWEPEQQEHMPVCAHTVLQRFPMPMSRLKIEPKIDAHELQCLPFQSRIYLPFQKSDLKQATDPLVLSGSSVPNSNVGSLPKRFLIFDQSGNHLRVMYLPFQKSDLKQATDPLVLSGSSVPNSNVGSLPKRFLIFDQSGNHLRVMYHVVDTRVHIPSTLFEKHSDYHCQGEEHALMENNVCVEETEMHEDSEETDALFYSDNDYDCSSDDEVTSTGHSPIVGEENDEEQKQRLEITEEMASSDGPRKRKRLLDGGFTKSSQLDTACYVKVNGSHEYYIDAESRYGIGHVEWNEINSGLGNVSSKKEKIVETLKVVESNSIIPGAKGKDPYLIIDEAINHLKSLKDEAKTVGDICY